MQCAGAIDGRPNTAEPDHGARVSDLRPGDELVFLDGDAHRDLVARTDVPVSSPGWPDPNQLVKPADCASEPACLVMRLHP
jgi:hypothetical protein